MIIGRWMEYEGFVKDMAVSYRIHVDAYGEKQTTLDRINNDRHYEPTNCKWSTYHEQIMNRRIMKKPTLR